MSLHSDRGERRRSLRSRLLDLGRRLSDPGTPLAPTDRMWWRMHGPTTPLIISAVLMFDEPVDVERLRLSIASRLDNLQRFHDRVERGETRRPVWRRDPAFDIEAHIRSSRLHDAGNRAVWAKVSALLSEPLDASKPPWCLDVVHLARGGSLLVARLHHAIADGIALMMVLLALTDLDPDDAASLGLSPDQNPLTMLFGGHAEAAELTRRYVERFLPGASKLLLRQSGPRRRSIVGLLIRAIVDGTRVALSRSDPKTLKKLNTSIRRVAWSESFALADVKRTAHRLEATINDILLSAVTGALRSHIQYVGERPDRDVRAAVPINLRPVDQMVDLGNRFGLLFLPLPVAIADPLERVRQLRKRSESLKRSGQPLATYGLMTVSGAGPQTLTDLVFWLFEKKVTAVMTNVPGPIRPLFLAGTKITSMVFWVPTAVTGLGISIGSYAGTIRLGVETDANLIDDPEPLVRAFESELRALFDLSRKNFASTSSTTTDAQAPSIRRP